MDETPPDKRRPDLPNMPAKGLPDEVPPQQSLDKVDVPAASQELLPIRATRDTGAISTGLTPGESREFPEVPGYEILGILGHGGMGVVYRARQIKANRIVALKMIRAFEHATLQDRLRFQIETEAVARLQHPNIVQLYEVGEVGGQPFFSLEFCPGGSLDQRLKTLQPTPRETAELIETLARAMHYAHLRGVVHRDLKPPNVLLTGEPRSVNTGSVPRATPGAYATGLACFVPKITDFGLAKRTDDAAREVSRSGAVMGTPAYMAPEQAGGKVRDTGPSTDIYALGAVLYECLTQRPPFVGATALDTLHQVLNDEPLPPSRLARKAPRDLETICLKCLRKEPAQRYRSAEELAEDLRRFRTGEPIRARAVGSLERTWRWCRRKPAIAALLVGVAASLLAVSLISWRSAVRADKNAAEVRASAREAALREAEAIASRKVAERRAYTSDMRLAHRAWEDAQLTRLRELLDPQLEELRGFDWHLLRRFLDGNLRSFPNPTEEGRRFWLGDRRLVIVAKDGTLTLRDGGDGRLLRQVKLTDYDRFIFCLAVSDDARLLATTSAPAGSNQYQKAVPILIRDMTTGATLCTLEGHTGPVPSLAFSPDGFRLASGGTDRTVRVWDVASGEELYQQEVSPSNPGALAFSPDGKYLAASVPAFTSGTGFQGMRSRTFVWEADGGRPVFTAGARDGDGGLLGSASGFVSFSPDGTRLASVGPDGHTVTVWQTSVGKELLRLQGHADLVANAAFSPDGRLLATASTDGTARLWDATTGEVRFIIRGHGGPLENVTFGGRPHLLTTAGRVGPWKVWDAIEPGEYMVLSPAWQDRLSFAGSSQGTYRVGFTPDGRGVLALSKERTLRAWNPNSGQEVQCFHFPGTRTGILPDVAWSPDGKRLTCARGNNLEVWDTASGRRAFVLEGHTKEVTQVAFRRDGSCLATASLDNSVRIWDANTGREMTAVSTAVDSVSALCFSSDGRQLAWGNKDGSVSVLDLKAGVPNTFRVHVGPVICLTFSPDGLRLASCADEKGQGDPKVWDAADGRERFRLQGHREAARRVVFSPDGSRLATVGGGREIRLWDATTGQETLILTEVLLADLQSRVNDVAFAPDGRRLALATGSGRVIVLDIEPTDETLRVRREALGLYRFLIQRAARDHPDSVTLREKVVEAASNQRALSDEMRSELMALAQGHRENAPRLLAAAWKSVRDPTARVEAYRLARDHAEACHRLDPGEPACLSHWGAALYRLEDYDAALEKLTQAETLGAERNQGAYPSTLKFLAMTQYRLGHKGQAVQTLDRLRNLVQTPEWSSHPEAKDLPREAEELIGK